MEDEVNDQTKSNIYIPDIFQIYERNSQFSRIRSEEQKGAISNISSTIEIVIKELKLHIIANETKMNYTSHDTD